MGISFSSSVSFWRVWRRVGKGGRKKAAPHESSRAEVTSRGVDHRGALAEVEQGKENASGGTSSSFSLGCTESALSVRPASKAAAAPPARLSSGSFPLAFSSCSGNRMEQLCSLPQRARTTFVQLRQTVSRSSPLSHPHPYSTRGGGGAHRQSSKARASAETTSHTSVAYRRAVFRVETVTFRHGGGYTKARKSLSGGGCRWGIESGQFLSCERVWQCPMGRCTYRASRSDSRRARMSFSRTGPLTFLFPRAVGRGQSWPSLPSRSPQ